MSAAAIEVEGLTKDYGHRSVLRGVDLVVDRGAVFCLLGPNGAGKTTCVEVLEGYRQATGGRVRVLGIDPSTQPQELRERIGVVLQECGFPKQLRVGELLDAWRSYYPNPRPLAELLEIVELRGDEHTPVMRLSGGQRRRLDFALALAGNPDLVFLDEPTTGFDPDARRRCWSAIENLRALGTTILLTTHYLDEAEHLADRIAFLSGGRVTAAGTTQELAAQAGAPTRISCTVTPRHAERGLVLPEPFTLQAGGTRAEGATGDPTAALRRLLRWADRHGVDVSDLVVAPPTLDDVYRHLTGDDHDDGGDA